jgi:hypothetical protein
MMGIDPAHGLRQATGGTSLEPVSDTPQALAFRAVDATASIVANSRP